MGRLQFIRRARELGFPLEDVRALLDLAESPQACCAEVSAMADRHLATVARKIADLERLRSRLMALREQCDTDATGDCPILDALTSPD